MRKLLITAVIASLTMMFAACNSNQNAGNTGASTEPAVPSATDSTAANGNPSYDPNRGEGKFKDVQLADKLDATMASAGEKIFTVKCSSCHKLTGEKLVGPGWLGVTSRHKPEWIMNFVTNTDDMISKDPAAQAMLQICLVRMPNQSLSDEDARNILEFMRKNDGVK